MSLISFTILLPLLGLLVSSIVLRSIVRDNVLSRSSIYYWTISVVLYTMWTGLEAYILLLGVGYGGGAG